MTDEVTIPQMRALAFDTATAPSIAVIEDHVLVPPGGAQALLLARVEAVVVGRGVRNAATGYVLDWAAFLCEYSHLLPPLAAGPSDWVTGNNTVYDRTVLASHREVTHARRSYPGARVADASLPRRLAFGLAAFALPPLLLWRTVSRTLRKQVNRSLVWKTVPLTALFVCAWGAGEVVGYWFGAGDSLRKVC